MICFWIDSQSSGCLLQSQNIIAVISGWIFLRTTLCFTPSTMITMLFLPFLTFFSVNLLPSIKVNSVCTSSYSYPCARFFKDRSICRDDKRYQPSFIDASNSLCSFRHRSITVRVTPSSSPKSLLVHSCLLQYTYTCLQYSGLYRVGLPPGCFPLGDFEDLLERFFLLPFLTVIVLLMFLNYYHYRYLTGT